LGNLATANYFTGTFINGTSNIAIPTPNGNINLTTGGNTSLVVTNTGANITGNLGVTGNFSVGSLVSNNLKANLNVFVGNTTVTWGTTTTFTATPNQPILSIPVAGITGIEYIVKAIDMLGSKYSMATVQAVTDETSVDFATFGTLNLNGQTISMLGSASGSTFQTALGTKNITFNGGTIQCTLFNNVAPTNFTTTEGTSEGKIRLIGNSSNVAYFYGGGSIYNCNLIHGTSVIYIYDSNTIKTISNSYAPAVFYFLGATTTITNWNIYGLASNLVTINGNKLSNASGVVSSDYLYIQNSTATGGATWYAGANSTDAGGNTGWIFTAPPATATGNFLVFF
jgi:hypothetical protein